MNKPLKMLVGSSIALMFSVGGLSAAYAQDASTDGSASAPVSKLKKKEAKWTADHKLEVAVRKALTKQQVESSDIRVVARAGAVTLDGTVEDDAMIPVAGDAAKSVAGVKSVKNNLTMHEAGN